MYARPLILFVALMAPLSCFAVTVYKSVDADGNVALMCRAIRIADSTIQEPVVMLWAIVRKAWRAHVPLLSGPGRKFVLSFSPPMLAIHWA